RLRRGAEAGHERGIAGKRTKAAVGVDNGDGSAVKRLECIAAIDLREGHAHAVSLQVGKLGSWEVGKFPLPNFPISELPNFLRRCRSPPRSPLLRCCRS